MSSSVRLGTRRKTKELSNKEEGSGQRFEFTHYRNISGRYIFSLPLKKLLSGKNIPFLKTKAKVQFSAFTILKVICQKEGVLFTV